MSTVTPAPSPTDTANPSCSSSIPQTAAAGGASFTQPAQPASVSCYKIAPSAPITFGYTMTSLYVTPTAFKFCAFYSLNGNTFNITTVAPTAMSVTWTPYAYEQSPKIQARFSWLLRLTSFKLWTSGDRWRGQGLFSPKEQARLAFYKPQPYTSPFTSRRADIRVGTGALFNMDPRSLAASLKRGVSVQDL